MVVYGRRPQYAPLVFQEVSKPVKSRISEPKRIQSIGCASADLRQKYDDDIPSDIEWQHGIINGISHIMPDCSNTSYPRLRAEQGLINDY